VIPRGFSGYNSRQWVTVSKHLCLKSDMATLWLGANDASESKQQGVPLSEYRDNITAIVHTLKVTKC